MENKEPTREEITRRASVEWFANAMEKRLRETGDKSGYSFYADVVSLDSLERRLEHNLDEWRIERNPKELVDIANFAMMIWNRKMRTGKYV